MGGAGNPLNSLAGGVNAPGVSPPAAGPLGGLLTQFVGKCANCLQCLKDKLCTACAGGLKDGDEKCRAAEAFSEQGWQGALAFMQGQGTGMRMAIGADA